MRGVARGSALLVGLMLYGFSMALMVRAGLGISVVPREVSRMYVSSGHVRVVSLLDTWARREFAICYRRQSDLTPAAERLLHFLRRQAQSE